MHFKILNIALKNKKALLQVQQLEAFSMATFSKHKHIFRFTFTEMKKSNLKS